MALLGRVSSLLRANVNGMLDRAEDPWLMLQQALRDLRAQAQQVKTHTAVLLADEHVLEKRAEESFAEAESWHRRAELALEKEGEALARVALERASVAHKAAVEASRQATEQRGEITAMREHYFRLQTKIAEAEAEGAAWQMSQRRSQGKQVLHPAAQEEVDRRLKQLRAETSQAEAEHAAQRQMSTERTPDEVLLGLEKEHEVDRMLALLKEQRQLAKQENAVADPTRVLGSGE